jgi:hypothetical protein
MVWAEAGELAALAATLTAMMPPPLYSDRSDRNESVSAGATAAVLCVHDTSFSAGHGGLGRRPPGCRGARTSGGAQAARFDHPGHLSRVRAEGGHCSTEFKIARPVRFRSGNCALAEWSLCVEE